MVNLSINRSVGWTAAVRAAADRLVAAGIPLIESAGNQNDRTRQGGVSIVHIEACDVSFGGPGILTVGGSDVVDGQSRDGRWVREGPATTGGTPDPSYSAYCDITPPDCGSNTGACVDLWAPAGHIWSTRNSGPTNARSRLSGTSMAAAHVSGAVALYLEEHWNAADPPTPTEIEQAIVGGATCDVLENDPASLYRIGDFSPNRLLDTRFAGSGSPCNRPPAARWTFSGSGLGRTLDGSTSTDDRGIVRYEWQVGGKTVGAGPVLDYFFPSYGSHEVVLTVTDSNGVQRSSPAEIELPEPAVIPQQGMWYDPARSGHGIDFYVNGEGDYTLFWYTYTEDGTPTWYLSDSEPMLLATWSATLYRATWNGSSTELSPRGTVSLTFDDDGRRAWFEGQVGDQLPRKDLFEFLHGGSGRSGFWIPSEEEGWGVQISDADGTMVATVAFYENGQPRWVQGQGPSTSIAGLYLRWYEGPGLCPACTGNTPPTSQAAGWITLDILSSSATTGRLWSSINMPSGARWIRSSAPIEILTLP